MAPSNCESGHALPCQEKPPVRSQGAEIISHGLILDVWVTYKWYMGDVWMLYGWCMCDVEKFDILRQFQSSVEYWGGDINSPDHWTWAPLYQRRGSHWKQRSSFSQNKLSKSSLHYCGRGIFTWLAESWQRRGSVREQDQEARSLTRLMGPLMTES